MYTLTSKAIATGVIALALLAAAPVFADSNRSRDDNGIHLGVLANIFHEDSQDRREDRREDRKQNRATSTTATTTKQFTIVGSVTAISGTTLTVQGVRGVIHTVNASNATITGHADAALALGSIKVGDNVTVKGTMSGSTVIATKVRVRSDLSDKIFRSFDAGIVTAINGTSVTLSNFGSSGSTNVTTNTATKYKVNGTSASSSALTVGSHVLVLGTSTATSTTSVNASIIVILTEGLNWIRHFWR